MAVGKFIKYGIVTGVAVAGAVVAYKNRKKIKAKTVETVKPIATKVEDEWNKLDKSEKRVYILFGSTLLFTGGFFFCYWTLTKPVYNTAVQAIDGWREANDNNDELIDMVHKAISTGRDLFKSGYTVGWYDAGGKNPITPSERVQSVIEELNVID